MSARRVPAWAGLAAAALLLRGLSPDSCLAAALGSGAAFLRIDTGARPAAMGGAYTAVADDVNALSYNPGGLPLLVRREVALTHAQWLLGSTFDFIGFGQTTKLGAFGLGVTRLAASGIEGRGADRTAQGGFEASDTAYAAGFGRRVALFGSGSTSLGGSLKYLESRIGAASASTLAFDLGAMHRFKAKPLSVGVSVLNLGRGLRFIDQLDPLPLTLSAGGAYRLAGSLNLALDVRHEPYDRRLDVGVGTEYALLSVFSLRAGYASLTPSGAGGTPFSGLAAGFGIRLSSWRADYTFTPMGALGDAQRISLGARF